MPPKRTRKIEIFNDDKATIPTRSSPRNTKRRRLDSGEKLPATEPTGKRSALGKKTANSRDTSLLRDTKQEGSFIDGKPLKQEKRDVVLASELLPSDTISKPTHSPDIQHLSLLLNRDKVQEAADFIAEKGLWTPSMLSKFEATSLVRLDLSSPATPNGVLTSTTPSSQLLFPLFTQDRFTALTSISLRNTGLSNDDVALLRLLPVLTILDLCATGISNTALHHLVCHQYTLSSLNISNNERITDDARVMLSALPKLTKLYLRGTYISMPALRRLASTDLAKSCRLLSIPAPAIEVLNNRCEKYCVDIPSGYILDPAKVDRMTLPVLKKNLELHSKYNREIQVTGTKIELVHRLRSLLSNRAADERIIEILGRVPE